MACPHKTGFERWTACRGKRRLASEQAPVAKARYIRDANLKALYGISLPQYEELLRRQGGVCAICIE